MSVELCMFSMFDKKKKRSLKTNGKCEKEKSRVKKNEILALKISNLLNHGLSGTVSYIFYEYIDT